MIIRTDSGKITGIVELDEIEKEQSLYCGHFTVETLQQFVKLISDSIKPTEMVEIRTLFVEGNNGEPGDYRLLAAEDDRRNSNIRIAVVGCTLGKFGNDK